MDLLSFLLLGPLQKYRAIGANNVARAMVYSGKQNKTGIRYYRYAQIMELARRLMAEKEKSGEVGY